jgi:norsolorinic acid ketoreductase
MDVLKEHVETNAYGPLLQFQAFAPLLKKSDKPKFAAIGSALGSAGSIEKRPFPSAAYGISKVILHFLVRKAHFEGSDWGLTAFVLDPGFVQTDMGNKGAKAVGLEKAFSTIEESLAFMVPAIDGATKETIGGRFPSIEGGDLPW